MKRLTDLFLMEVVNEDGQSLGRVIEVRSQGEPEHGVIVKERQVSQLICGPSSLLVLLGLKKSEVKTVPWEAVTAIRGQKIVVKIG